MSNKTTVATLLARNAEIASTSPPQNPYLAECPQLGFTTPKVLVITCVDPRCDPTAILGLKKMEAVVVRNPCGHVAPEIDGLLALDIAVGGLAEVMIIHHTDCGATHYTDAGIREKIRETIGSKRDLLEMSFGAITDIEQSVRDDLAFWKEHPLVRPELKEKTVGCVYDIKTGVITKVDA